VRGSPVSHPPATMSEGHLEDWAGPPTSDVPTVAQGIFAVAAYSTGGVCSQSYLNTGDVVVVEGTIDPATNQVLADLIANTKFLAHEKAGTWIVHSLDGPPAPPEQPATQKLALL